VQKFCYKKHKITTTDCVDVKGFYMRDEEGYLLKPISDVRDEKQTKSFGGVPYKKEMSSMQCKSSSVIPKQNR